MDKIQRKEYLKPMSNLNTLVNFEYILTDSELTKIHQGLESSRWYIFFEDKKLFFHRTLTGDCIFIALFDNSNKYKIQNVIITRNKEDYDFMEEKSDLIYFEGLLKDLIN